MGSTKQQYQHPFIASSSHKTSISGMLAGPGGKSGNLINIDDDTSGGASGGQMSGQSKTQMLLEEEANLQVSHNCCKF